MIFKVRAKCCLTHVARIWNSILGNYAKSFENFTVLHAFQTNHILKIMKLNGSLKKTGT